MFYELVQKDIRKIKDILVWAHKNAIKTEICMLDCSKSFARRKVDTPFKEMVEKITYDALGFFCIILRKNGNGWGIISDNNEPIDFLEIGIRNIMIMGIEYFIFIYLEDTKLLDLKKIYKIKAL